jgi:hypothetical protein
MDKCTDATCPTMTAGKKYDVVRLRMRISLLFLSFSVSLYYFCSLIDVPQSFSIVALCIFGPTATK